MARQVPSPLELFLRDFVGQSGGVWDEVEPQVYHILLPAGGTAAETGTGGEDVVRVTFDPDALPDHPQAQLASFGTPFIDRLLAAAARQGRSGKAYRVGLNLTAHGLEQHARHALSVPPGIRWEVQRVRGLFVPIGVFWFEATFVSDQKEHQILPIGFDLHYARQVRHLEPLLDSGFLADQPDVFLADAKHAAPAEIFPLARQEVLRTLASLANDRARELGQRVDRQVARMQQYYRDLLQELDQQQGRAQQRGTDGDKYQTRRETLLGEQQLRIAEVRQKNTLHVHLRLAALLVVRQPKLILDTYLTDDRGRCHPLQIVWDPLVESLEAAPCPACHRPTFAFELDRQHCPVCPSCTTRPVDRQRGTSIQRPTHGC